MQMSGASVEPCFCFRWLTGATANHCPSIDQARYVCDHIVKPTNRAMNEAPRYSFLFISTSFCFAGWARFFLVVKEASGLFNFSVVVLFQRNRLLRDCYARSDFSAGRIIQRRARSIPDALHQRTAFYTTTDKRRFW